MDNVLNHVAFILDGNGRWAKQRGLLRTDGHRVGAERAFTIAKHAFNFWHIPYVTYYCFSTENWKRPSLEIKTIFKILEVYLKKQRSTFLENHIRFLTIGDLTDFPKSLQKGIQDLKDATQHFTDYNLVLALNYGAREEVLQAVYRWQLEHQDKPTWQDFSKYLYTANIPDPDLIIRTSGEMRLSNYLCLQAAYAELYFTSTYWPDFDEKALDAAIEDYKKRERRFGNLSKEDERKKL